jgi:Domain of unknown function (DUF5658)
MDAVILESGFPAAGRTRVAAGLVVDRRQGERRRTPRVGGGAHERRVVFPAVVKWRDGRALCEYTCPRCGTHHQLQYGPRAARAYAVAVREGECACPGRQAWHVRRGVARVNLVFWLLLALWVFNIADLVLTRRALSLGMAREANHVMAYFLAAGLLPAVIFKVGIVTLGALLLWCLRRHAATLMVAAALASAYALVVVYQALHVLP